MNGRAEADTISWSDGSAAALAASRPASSGGAPMLDDREWIVPFTLVRHADGVPRAEHKTHGAARESARVEMLRKRVKTGHYASATMMDALARRILALGDV
jgi:hypothetical protein